MHQQVLMDSFNVRPIKYRIKSHKMKATACYCIMYKSQDMTVFDAGHVHRRQVLLSDFLHISYWISAMPQDQRSSFLLCDC